MLDSNVRKIKRRFNIDEPRKICLVREYSFHEHVREKGFSLKFKEVPTVEVPTVELHELNPPTSVFQHKTWARGR